MEDESEVYNILEERIKEEMIIQRKKMTWLFGSSKEEDSEVIEEEVEMLRCNLFTNEGK